VHKLVPTWEVKQTKQLLPAVMAEESQLDNHNSVLPSTAGGNSLAEEPTQKQESAYRHVSKMKSPNKTAQKPVSRLLIDKLPNGYNHDKSAEKQNQKGFL